MERNIELARIAEQFGVSNVCLEMGASFANWVWAGWKSPRIEGSAPPARVTRCATTPPTALLPRVLDVA